MRLTENERAYLYDWIDEYLHPHLKALTERQQDCVLLRFVEDLTEVEIAGRLGISQQAVAQHIRYALKRLKASESFLVKLA